MHALKPFPHHRMIAKVDKGLDAFVLYGKGDPRDILITLLIIAKLIF